MSGTLELMTSTPAETEQVGRAIGDAAFPGAILLLSGTLGAGKTLLAQGVARGLEVSGPVTSPTFTLINEYHGRMPFYHCDFFRLDTPEQLTELGIDEYLYGDGVCAVEWPERLGGRWPEEFLSIGFTAEGGLRQLSLEARGAKHHALLDAVRGVAGGKGGDTSAGPRD